MVWCRSRRSLTSINVIFTFTWMTAVSAFVFAFPCALGLAAPTAMTFGTVVGVRLRVLGVTW